MPPFDDRNLCDNEDIFLREDVFSGETYLNSDYEDYIVFTRVPNDFSQKQWTKCFAGETVGHEASLREAVKASPVEIHYPREFLTVNTTSGNVRHHKVSLTIEEIA